MTLTVERATIRDGRRTVLLDLSFSIAPGEALTVMGPSGSGKSSLLAYCCGALPPGCAAGGASCWRVAT